MVFNDWKYIKDKQGVRIIPDSEKTMPNSFIKYYGLNGNSIDSLTKSYLFFSHPLILNDPFDSCRQLVSLDKFSERQFVQLQYKNQNLATPGQRFSLEKIQSKVAEWYKKDKMDLADSFLTFFWNLIFKDWGVLSLSGTDNDMLMWSYYNCHQGIALELDNDLFDNKEIYGPFPMNYVENYETIKPRSIKLDVVELLYVTNVKFSQWNHENEWRFLVKRENMSIPNYDDPFLSLDKRKVNYPKKKLKSIILGYKFFEENMTKTYLGKGKRLYRFKPEKNDRDKLRLKVIDFALKNNVKLREIEIAEDNSFTLNTMNIKLTCKQNRLEYLIESKI